MYRNEARFSPKFLSLILRRLLLLLEARDSGSQGPVSIVIVDAALKKELKENRATNKVPTAAVRIAREQMPFSQQNPNPNYNY